MTFLSIINFFILVSEAIIKIVFSDPWSFSDSNLKNVKFS